MKVIVCITGASGVVYGVRLLERLPPGRVAVVSAEAEKLLEAELGRDKAYVFGLAEEHFENDDMFSPYSSGSSRFDAVVIAPCSMSTMSKIACGIADNLITRMASVALKERRRLVLLVRETPLSEIHLGNMERLAHAGATVMPASPAFYPEPKSVYDLVDFVVGRVMDQLDIDHRLYRRWSGKRKTATGSRASRRSPR